MGDAQIKNDQRPIRRQFSLRTLLLLPVIAALICSAHVWFGTEGAVVAAVGAAIVASYMPVFEVAKNWRETRNIARIYAFLAMVTVIYACLPRIGSRRIDPKINCECKLKEIGIALRQYHADFGSFPPA